MHLPWRHSARLLDGREEARALRQEMAARVRRLARPPKLAIIFFGEASQPGAFIRQKARACVEAGIVLRQYALPETISISEAGARINQIVRASHSDGIVLQLPFPATLNRNRHGLLRIIPEDRDVDCLSERWLGRMQTGRMTLQFKHGAATLLPPVVGAIARLLERNGIAVAGRRVAIVGWGDLVGKPVASWFLRRGATVTVVTSAERNLGAVTRSAEILVSAAGAPNLITGAMVRRGALVIDAGSAERDGKVLGDIAQRSVVRKASMLTPTPGGIGPLAIAMLLRNVVALAAVRSGFRS